ncbi:MAG: hypothetical protein IPK19_39790 [Chloroflexi bacterium]|nr:hypothetical protein [Chloroflexota bacterium]
MSAQSQDAGPGSGPRQGLKLERRQREAHPIRLWIGAAALFALGISLAVVLPAASAQEANADRSAVLAQGDEPTPAASPTASPSTGGQARAGQQRGVVERGGGQVWLFTGHAGERLTLQVTADRPAHTPQDMEYDTRGLDARVVLYAPDGTWLAENDDIIEGIWTDSLLEGIVLPLDGAYRIEVRSWDDQSGGGYVLSVEVEPSSGTPIPGGPDATARPRTAGEAHAGEQVGRVEVGGGQVWLYFGHGGEVLTVRVDADLPAQTGADRPVDPEGFDPVILLYGPDGRLVAQSDDRAEGETDARVETFELPEFGVYRIEVRGKDELSGGGYTLTIESVMPAQYPRPTPRRV